MDSAGKLPSFCEQSTNKFLLCKRTNIILEKNSPLIQNASRPLGILISPPTGRVPQVKRHGHKFWNMCKKYQRYF